MLELGYDEIEKVMVVNFWGVVHMVRTFLPLLLERPRASLVNVSSMGALGPVPGQTAYGASKAAIKLLTEGLYAELRGGPVTVTAVYPGGIGTAIADNSGAGVPGAGENPGLLPSTGGHRHPAEFKQQRVQERRQRRCPGRGLWCGRLTAA